MLMMSTAMMKTTMLVVTMTEVLAALAMIPLDCGMLTALFVNVLRVYNKIWCLSDMYCMYLEVSIRVLLYVI